MSTPLDPRADPQHPPADQTAASSDETRQWAATTSDLSEIRREADTLRANQQRDVAALRDELALHMAAMRETLALIAPPGLLAIPGDQAARAHDSTDVDSTDDSDGMPLSSRRAVLKWGGLAAVAGLAAGGATLASPTARASDGAHLILGSSSNTAEHTTTLTYDGAESNPVVLKVVASPSDSRAINANAGGGTTATTSGVYGTAGTSGRGVLGSASGPTSFGVWGASASGHAVVGTTTDGIDLAAKGTGRLAQAPLGIVGAPKSGSYFAGEQVRDSYGNLFICVTGGSPGVWQKVVGRNTGYRAGTISFLSTPIRVYDSRVSGGALIGNATRNVQVTGVIIGGVEVPAGAIGCIGNLTVTSPSASGYVVIYPQGSATPSTSTVNFLTHQTVANSFSVGLSAGGQVTVHSFTSGQCHFIVDVTGFIAPLE